MNASAPAHPLILLSGFLVGITLRGIALPCRRGLPSEFNLPLLIYEGQALGKEGRVCASALISP